MYQRNDAQFGAGAATVALTLDAAIGPIFGRAPARIAAPKPAQIDLVIDLGLRLGSAEWWRGLATCTALCGAAVMLGPSARPLVGASPTPFAESERVEAEVQAIAPLGLGADTGRRVAANVSLVEPLAETPERPRIETTATIGLGDGFARVLERNGVSDDEAKSVARMVAGVMPVGDIRSGTKLAVVLGRRPSRSVARPLESLAFRAKFELSLAIERIGGALRLRRIPIAVDSTPLRVQGRVGSSLFAAARGSGAPARAVDAYLKAIGSRVSIGREVRAGDRFDIIVARRRAATGEVEMGDLLYAGLSSGKRDLRLLRWTDNGRQQWFDQTGTGETRGSMRAPVIGRLTSTFGMRRHPLLGYSRMHQGVDYGAPTGTPIVAATDGVVAFAGWHGGHGNYVRLNHSGGMATGYGHMSRIIARPGQRVQMGQLIGYVGSTGLSTGPHLHYELYRNGAPINPGSVKFTTTARLAGGELARFKGQLSRLLSVRLDAPVAKTADAAKGPKPAA